MHAVFVDPVTWCLMRFVTGFAYAGLFIVSESWLNDASENETRGQMMSFYMLISLAGMAGGQIMLNIAPPSSYELFVLISVLVTIPVIPILSCIRRYLAICQPCPSSPIKFSLGTSTLSK